MKRKRYYTVAIMFLSISFEEHFKNLLDALDYVKDMAKCYHYYSGEFYIFDSFTSDPLAYSGVIAESHIYFDVFKYKVL